MASKIVSTGRKQAEDRVLSWDDAITYAEEQIEQSRRRIRVLEGTIQLFEDRRQSGDPFPGDVQRLTGARS